MPTSLNNVVGVFAHPDDETIMLGGTLAMLHAYGVNTHIVCATRGEGGEMGDPPVVSARPELGEARERELRCALNHLGVRSLTLLGYRDPEVGPENTLSPFAADFDTLVDQIGALLREKEADIVVAHGPDGEYGHPAHKLIHRATREAIAHHAPGIPFYSVAATVPGVEDHLWNKSRAAQFVLDITPWAARKVAAMECHITQHALFKRRRKLQHVRDALRPFESFYCEWPETNGQLPVDGFANLLQEAGATSP